MQEDNAEPKIKDRLQHAMISLGIPTAMNYMHHRNSLKAFYNRMNAQWQAFVPN